MKMIFSKIRIKYFKGFSLIEVVITMAVLVILSTILLYKYPRTNDTLSFNFSIQELLSKIRYAQAIGSNQGGDYAGYGIYFESPSPSYGDGRIVEFLDKTNTADLNIYGVALSDKKCVETPLIGDYIINNTASPLYLVNKLYIGQGSVYSNVSNLHILFLRPNTNPIATTTDTSVNPSITNPNFSKIEMKSKIIPADQEGIAFKCIEIFSSGQIDIKNDKCY